MSTVMSASEVHKQYAEVASAFRKLIPDPTLRMTFSHQRDGYIRREPWQRDARRNRVLLTEKGLQAVEGCRDVFRRVSARMLAGFSLEEFAQLMDFQRRMLDNLLSSAPKTQEKE